MGGVADVKESKTAAEDAGRVGHPRLSKETAPDTAGATHDQPNRPTQAAAGNMAMQRSASAPLQVGAPAGPADPGWGVTKPAVTDDTPAIISPSNSTKKVRGCSLSQRRPKSLPLQRNSTVM